MRHLLELFSRNRVFRRTLKTNRGKRRIYVTPEASLKYWLPNSLNTDVPLQKFARHFITSGMKVWDLGANIGIVTYLAAAHVGVEGKVLAVEADPFISSLLIRSNQGLGAGDAVPWVFTVAVSDAISTAEFAVPQRSRASNYIIETGGCSQTGGVRHTFRVITVTVDWILEHSFSPDLIKLDIEGMEYRALAASKKILSEVRPLLHLEIWESIADDISRLFAANNYLMFDGEADLSLSNSIPRAAWCTIAIPAEKMARFGEKRPH